MYVRCNNTRRGVVGGLAAAQKESHEPTTPSLGRNALAVCVYDAHGETAAAAAIRTIVRIPQSARPERVPQSVRPSIDGFRSQGGCDARYTRPVAPIGPTAFPSATAATASERANVSRRRPVDAAAAVAVSLPSTDRRSESTDRRDRVATIIFFFSLDVLVVYTHIYTDSGSSRASDPFSILSSSSSSRYIAVNNNCC